MGEIAIVELEWFEDGEVIPVSYLGNGSGGQDPKSTCFFVGVGDNSNDFDIG